MKRLLYIISLIGFSLPLLAQRSGESFCSDEACKVQYVNPLMGTQSTFELSAGNTYPAIAMPWGMNFWTPRTAPMGDGWIHFPQI